MKKKELKIDCNVCENKLTTAFCNLKPVELHLLNQQKTTNLIKRKQTLFYENDVVKGLHCIKTGKVKLYKTLNDGSIRILRIAKGGDLIGYRGLLGDGKYIASAEVIEDAVVCFVTKERIFDYISKNLQFSLGMMSKIAGDISEVENRSMSFLQKSSKERLAEALLLLETTFGTTPDGYINILLTREEIASYTGMVVETTIRTLHAWELEGIITLHKKQIMLSNKTKLLEISKAEE